MSVFGRPGRFPLVTNSTALENRTDPPALGPSARIPTGAFHTFLLSSLAPVIPQTGLVLNSPPIAPSTCSYPYTFFKPFPSAPPQIDPTHLPIPTPFRRSLASVNITTTTATSPAAFRSSCRQDSVHPYHLIPTCLIPNVRGTRRL